MSARTEGTSDPGNYEYVSARVRARKAALFDDGDYRKLVRMGPSEIARFMEETEYETEMNELGTRYSGVDLVEYALTQNMAKHFDDLLHWAEGQLYDHIARYLRKFDAWNVKTVLRGLYSGADRAAIEDDLIRAGEFTEARLDSLVSAGSIEEAVDALEGTIFADDLAAALEDYEDTGTLVPLENAADRAFYETLVAPDVGSVEPDSPLGLYRRFLRAEIDFRNLRNALRLARSGADIDPSAYYIEGGDLFDEATVRRLATNEDQLVEFVRESTYGEALDEALDVLDEAGSLIEFENALDRALLEFADTQANRYPLSISPVLSYVLNKEREVDNVRAIARGREAGLSPEEIEQELVIL